MRADAVSLKPEVADGSCCLCSQIAGDVRGDLLHRWLQRGQYERTVADLAANWHAIPSIGALVPGHTLLCPGTHTRSFASAMSSDCHGAIESLALLDSALSACFGGPAQVFEHGNAADGATLACSIEHAHLHVVPGVPDLWPFIDGRVIWQPIAGIAALSEATGRSEYLLFRDSSAAWWVARAPAEGHPSQLMRRAVAAAIGEPDAWNWRLHPRLNQTHATAEAVMTLS